jgi:hypothetical protein
MKRPHEILSEDFSIKIQPKAKGLDRSFRSSLFAPLESSMMWRSGLQKVSRFNATLRMIRQAASGLLLANGYDPNGDGDSPLSEAVRSRNHTMVGLLLKYVTDPKGIKWNNHCHGLLRRLNLESA